jgi:hypothetical protein
MAAPAALKAHWGMLEGKGAALVAMAPEAARLVGGKYLPHGWPEAAVRIVAIQAAHRPLRQFVVVRPLKLRPYIGVTTCTLLVNGCELADNHAVWSVSVNFVA